MKAVVVITGLIRDVVELFRLLREVQKLRDQGLIKRVIISSWLTEKKVNEALFQRLMANEIEVLLSEPVSGPIGSSANSIFAHQAVSLLRALEEIESGEFILKLRTDKTAHLVSRFEGVLKKGLERVDRTDSRFVGHNWKLAVTSIRTSTLFHIHDVCFLGERDDLYYTINSTLALESRIPRDGLGVENRWCVGPFFLQNKLFRSFVENFHSYALLNYLNSWVKGDKNMPVVIAKILGAYYTQACYSFESVFQGNWEKRNLNIRKLLDPNDTELARTGVTSVGPTRSIHSLEIMRSMVEEHILDPDCDPGFRVGVLSLSETCEMMLTREDLAKLKVLLENCEYGEARFTREYLSRDRNTDSDASYEFTDNEGFTLQCAKLGMPASDAEKILKNISCELNSESIYVEIANLYFEGKALNRSIDYGEAWLRAGAGQRNRVAQFHLGKRMESGCLKTIAYEEVIKALEDLKRYDKKADELLTRIKQSHIR